MSKLYVGEVVEVHEGGDGPVDPGFGRPPRPPGHISGGPIIPPPDLPPLPGVWPPITPDRPWHELPEGSPFPPGMIWPGAGHPGNELPGTRPPGRPSNELPGTRPPHVGGGPSHPQKFVVLCWISGGIGWNYVVIDPSLTPGTPLPETPEAEPKE